MGARTCLPFALVVAAAGCTMTPEDFRRDPQALTNPMLCQTWVNASHSGDASFFRDVTAEAQRRQLSPAQCGAILQQARARSEAAAQTAIAAGAIGLAAGSRPLGSQLAAPPTLVPAQATSAVATWTGRLEMVTSVTGAAAHNCEYIYAGQKFWRAFTQSCPPTIAVQ